jgi:hypothetical protein
MSHEIAVPLQPFQVADYIRKIFEAGTRRQLNDLTREIWRRYARGDGATVNAAALANLKARILERRGMLDRSNRR